MERVLEDIVYLRSNGKVATNAIFRRQYGDKLIFMELIGFSNEVKGGLRLKGKYVFKRLFIQQVYPKV